MDEVGPKLFVRPFVAAWDYPVFADWLRVHGREEVPAWALPFVGMVVCERAESQALGDEAASNAASPPPLAIAFGYQDGRCGMVTWLTGRPGLPPRLALAACSLVTAAVERELEARGVRLMISPTERPSLVKFMRRRAWRVAHAANVLLYKMVEQAVPASNFAGDLFVARPLAADDERKEGESL